MDPEMVHPFKVPITKIKKEKLSPVIGVFAGIPEMAWPVISDFWNELTMAGSNLVPVLAVATNPDPIKIEVQELSKIYPEIQKSKGLPSIFQTCMKLFEELSSKNFLTFLNEKLGKSEECIVMNILFFSNGNDYDEANLKKRMDYLKFQFPDPKIRINFFCIALSKDFPGFLASKLRDIFHSGVNRMPLLWRGYISESSKAKTYQTLIKDLSKEFRNFLDYGKFEGYNINNFADCQISSSPWGDFRAPTNSTYSDKSTFKSFVIQGDWIFLNNPNPAKNKIPYRKNWSLNLKNFFDVSKICYNNALSKLFQNGSCKAEAGIILKMIETAMEGLVKKTSTSTPHGDEFFSKVSQKRLKQVLSDLSDFKNQIQKLGSIIIKVNSEPSKEEQHDLFSFPQNFGSLNNVADESLLPAFDSGLTELIEILENEPLKSNPQGQQPSLVIFQNQRDLFMEDKFAQALGMCLSPQDITENLPLVGYSVFLKRPPAGSRNPYQTEVISFARHHSVLDSITLLNSPDNTLTLNTGHNDQEVINGVLPLYDEHDKDLTNYIDTMIFRLLVNFNIFRNQGNIDFLLKQKESENSYFALLSSAFYALFNEKVSEWRKEIQHKIYKTIKFFILPRDEVLKSYVLSTLEVFEKPETVTKNENLKKTLLALFYLKEEGKLKGHLKTLGNLFRKMIFFAIKSTWTEKEDLLGLFEFEEPRSNLNMSEEWEKNLLSEVRNSIKLGNLTRFYTKTDLETALKAAIDKFKIESHLDKIKVCSKMKINVNVQKIRASRVLLHLENIYEYFLGEELDPEQYLLLFTQIMKNSSGEALEQNATEKCKDDYLNELIKAKLHNEVKNGLLYKNLWSEFHKQYLKIMNTVHLFTMPVSKKELEESAKIHGHPVTSFKTNKISGLLKNACCALNCPFYLKIDDRFKEHISIESSFPAFHKTVKKCVAKSDDEIMQRALMGEFLYHKGKGAVIEDTQVNYLLEEAEEIIQILGKIKQKYKEIDK